MYHYKNKLAYTFLVLVLCLVQSNANSTRRNCSILVRCSDVEDIVWATDGSKCFVHRNACLLGNTNCERENQNLPPLYVVTKEECQKLCPDVCLAVVDPVCGIYNGVKRTFSNSCQMEVHICKSGETYSLFGAGECN